MRILWCVVGHAATVPFRIALALLVLTPIGALADTDNCVFLRDVNYTYSGTTAMLTATEVANFDLSGTSGTLRMELWALNAPYTGVGTTGYKMAEYVVGQIVAGASVSNLSSGSVPFTSPPNGTWYVVLFLTENTGASFDDGYSVTDWRNFATPLVIGPTITPQVGLWWNPNESGSGYALDYKHGVLVVTIYSYTTSGVAQWYLASGPVSGNTFTSTLDKYIGGQCISCAYNGRPTLTGNDGMITIDFSSPTSATAYLPDGRVTQIQPEAF